MSTPILDPNGQQIKACLPKIKSIHPFGSKILVEILKADEVLGTALHLSENMQVDGAPQAYITELGPTVSPDCGLAVGQRVYWTGKGTQVDNPACSSGRVNALLEINNILAIIEEK